jgi:hypothetical protein
VVVPQGQRCCLGRARLTDNDPEAAVRAVLTQLPARGVRRRSLLLDRGFFSGHVLLALPEGRVPFVRGVPRKGGRGDKLFTLPSGRVAGHAWRTERGRRPVSVPLVRAGRRRPGRWRRAVYAFGGVGPAQAVGRYARARFYRERQRRRFGVETSYRQLNQGQALTTSTDARRRRRWRGVALRLRQAWVGCQYRLARRGRNGRYWEPDERLRLAVLLAGRAGALKER